MTVSLRPSVAALQHTESDVYLFFFLKQVLQSEWLLAGLLDQPNAGGAGGRGLSCQLLSRRPDRGRE